MKSRERVLVVDDEVYIRELVSQILSARYQVFFAASGDEALAAAKACRPSVIILDLSMPGIGGMETCRRLRGDPATRGIHIVMLTAFSELEQRIAAFESGADDFLAKPFRPEELLARVGAKVRRSVEEAAAAVPDFRLRCADLSVDVEALKVSAGDRPLDVGPVEFKILVSLMREKGGLVSRARLAGFVWGEEPASHRALDPHVSSLRRKLADTRVELKTTYGGGYSLVVKDVAP